jgi:nitroimidazol reductase NimA-like FMN-containing flavoprotein (pyridoxamine 5'-phosphate oxidase superfamily)
MRKKEREITDRHEIEAILQRARILRLAVNEAGAPPYVVPVNFGYRDGAIYFHSSYQGKKMELIARDPVVSFEAEMDVAIIPAGDNKGCCDWSVAYRSVIGCGRATLLTDPREKTEGLRAIIAAAAPDDMETSAVTFPDKILDITAVIKIEIEEMTGKKNRV